ncbi:hypothetical protein DY468_23955 [Rhodopseudomonas sp. BR0M22]|nr:hypothetical protein [Rhodopseudomonas sp. BR0M22]
MATYKEIAEYVRRTSGFAAKPCWIADLLSEHGLTKRMAHNREDPRTRKHPCPSAKRTAIEAALRHFRMI